MTKHLSLRPEQLLIRCDLADYGFADTADLSPSTELLGQERALQAIELAIGTAYPGFNLFVMGPNGTGKNTALARYLTEVAPQQPVPDDWCYVYSFDQPERPRALRLPAGQAAAFAADLKDLVNDLFTALPAAFASKEYQTQRAAMEESFKSRQAQSLEALREKAREHEIAFIQTPGGYAFAPLKNGEVVSPDEYMGYSTEAQQTIQKQVQELQDALQQIMRQVPLWQREAQAQLRALNEDVARFAVEPLFEELEVRYRALPDVLDHLHKVQTDVVSHFDLFLDEERLARTSAPMQSFLSEGGVTRYFVNVMAGNGALHGAPVIFEDQPRYHNLTGRLEHVSQQGALVTDFSLIKPGALHKANGGYLILDARKLLEQPYAYDGLKQAIKSGQIHIESLGQAYSLISTVSVDPEPIPLKIKVILVGERQLYYLLYQHDPEFAELFKVVADFEDDMPRTDTTTFAYAKMIASMVHKEGLRQMERTAVERVIEQAARWAGDGTRLTAHMQTVSDLLREADYKAAVANHPQIARADVEAALEAQELRAGRVRDRLQEQIMRDFLLIDSSGAVTGQVNGLAVYRLGPLGFGKPTRITARVSMGKGEVIDIERQTEMGGPIHSKGVLILSGFLAGRYADKRPLSFSSTLVFEQSYSGVEGDSASLAELYALISALAEVPIKQSLAVTGSVNQLGQVQAIGGVNEKIEGFFDLCMARGLTGDQGVLIPAANIEQLMLKEAVVGAVRQGKFAIYAVATIDEGIELLTGIPAGEPDPDGDFPADSVNGRAVARLEKWLEIQRKLQAPANATASEA